MASTPGLPLSLSLVMPAAGVPPGTVVYWQDFAIDGNAIIASDVYESEIR